MAVLLVVFLAMQLWVDVAIVGVFLVMSAVCTLVLSVTNGGAGDGRR